MSPTKICPPLSNIPLHPNTVNLTGQKFGFLTVIGHSDKRQGSKILWVCKCRCGNLHAAIGPNLKRRTGSCGCSKGERISNNRKVHGMSKTRVYRIWRGMRRRCHDNTNAAYNQYGKRGIKVCRKWRAKKTGFQAFLTDMGDPGNDSKLTIERRENNKGYYKENCYWATMKQQQGNRRNNIRITYNGKTQILAEWARETGLKYYTIVGRLARDWPIEKTLTTPTDDRYRRNHGHSHGARDRKTTPAR